MEILLQLLTLLPIFYLTQNYTSILLLSISIDSIFSALYFIKNLILNSNQSQKEFINNINQLYTTPLFDRYIFYLLLEITYIILKLLFWNYKILPLYYLLLLTTCPHLLNQICQIYLHKLFHFINLEKQKFIKTIISKQLSFIINTLSSLCIDKDPQINHVELLFLFDDYDKTLSNFTDFIKSFLIISLVHYARKNSRKMYGQLIKYFYSYKTGNIIESLDINTAKSRFSDVIINRKWDQLLNTEILQSIMYIYIFQESPKNDYVDIYLTKITYSILQMFSLWTISAFLELSPISPLLSIFYLIYKQYKEPYQYLFRIFALSLCYFIPYHYLLISCICEFMYPLVFNRITNTILNYFYNKIIHISKICIHNNSFNLFFISIFFYLKLLPNITTLILSFIFIILNIESNYKKFITLISFIFGSLSYYNCYHLLFIITILYLYINIDTYYGNKNISIITNKASIIESYYGNNNPIHVESKPNPPKIINKYHDIKIYSSNNDIIHDYHMSKSKLRLSN